MGDLVYISTGSQQPGDREILADVSLLLPENSEVSSEIRQHQIDYLNRMKDKILGLYYTEKDTVSILREDAKWVREKTENQ